MNILSSGDQHSFAIEVVGKNLRLVDYLNGVENVCRKCTAKNILTFLQSNENQLFKGRLQLHRHNGGINVIVKGSKVGEIAIADLLAMIEKSGEKLPILA